MQGEVQVVHTIVAVGETEIDASATECHLLTIVLALAVLLVIFGKNGGVIDGIAVLTLQYAALKPYLIGTRENGNIVEQYLIVANVGEDQRACCGEKQGLKLSVETFGLKQQHMFRGLVADKVDEVVEQLLWHIELFGHGAEDRMDLGVLDTTELHDTQQQHRFFRSADLTMQIVANRSYDGLCVQIVTHLVDTPHVGIKA